MQLALIDCFCQGIKSGNRAAVIIDFSGKKLEKQQIAHDLNLPVTVFIAEKDSPTPVLEYFYSETEMPLCLHGTIAAGSILLGQERKSCCLVTGMDHYPLDVIRQDDLVQVKVAQQEVPAIEIEIPLICKMLGLTDERSLENTLPLSFASVGSPKLLIPVKSAAILHKLKPDFFLIKAWSLQNRVNGLYVYSLPAGHHLHGHFVARGFNPKTGHQEDAATGVAAAALALFLKQSIVIEQGHHLGSPCMINVSYINDNCIFVGGRVNPLQKSVKLPAVLHEKD